VYNASKVRHQILDGFKELGETLTEIDYSLGMFPHDHDVRKCAVSLVATILDTVEKVIVFYEKNIVRKIGSALFHGEEYQEEVLQGLTDIQTRSKYLASQVQRSYMSYSRQEIRKSNRLGRDTNDIVRTTDARTENMESLMVNMYNALYHMFDDHESKKQEELATLRRQMEELQRTNQVLTHTVRSLTPSPRRTVAQLQLEQSSFGKQGNNVTPEALWSLLHVEKELEKIDVDVVEDKQESLPWTDRGRAGPIVNTEQFKTWMVSPRPATLLMHGDCASLGGVSALSLLCSTLTQALRRRSNFLSLSFFCGLHDEEDGQYYGGAAVLRSFIAQLLCQQPFDTRNIQHYVNIAGAERGQVASLCQIFGWLVRQLPAELTIVCIIDEIAYYERDAAVDEMLEVLAYITQTMYDSNHRATLKILSTSTIAVREMRDFFPVDSVLDLSAVSSFDVSSGYGVQRQLQDSLQADQSDMEDEVAI
jgi:hypothetical protein